MANYSNTGIDLFSVLILFILFSNIKRQHEDYFPDQKIFLWLVVSVGAILIADAVQWTVSQKPSPVFRWMNIVFGILYYTAQAIPCVCWCFYVRYKCTINMKETVKIWRFVLIIVIMNTAFSFMSGLHNVYFYVDINNIYHRGKFFWAFILIEYSAFLYALIYVLVKKRKVDKAIYLSLMKFAFPPLIGGVVQAFYFGVSLVWPCATFAILTTYISIQNGQMYTDYLTGLSNRRMLDIYLDQYLRKMGRAAGIGAIMIDIDGFKSINDEFGHIVGDQALAKTAEVLKKSLGKKKFIARYGGDEFVVISDVKNKSEIERIVRAIEAGVEKFNAQSEVPYTIKLSIGYEIFRCGSGITRDVVFNCIDSVMYAQKKSR